MFTWSLPSWSFIVYFLLPFLAMSLAYLVMRMPISAIKPAPPFAHVASLLGRAGMYVPVLAVLISLVSGLPVYVTQVVATWLFYMVAVYLVAMAGIYREDENAEDASILAVFTLTFGIIFMLTAGYWYLFVLLSFGALPSVFEYAHVLVQSVNLAVAFVAFILVLIADMLKLLVRTILKRHRKHRPVAINP